MSILNLFEMSMKNFKEEIQGSENNALGLYKKMPSKNRMMLTQKAL